MIGQNLSGNMDKIIISLGKDRHTDEVVGPTMRFIAS